MRKIFIPFLVICLLACQHDDIPPSKDVWIRIENASADNFDNTAIGTVDYAFVPIASVTDYKLMPFQIYGAGCSFIINGSRHEIGSWWCGSPPPPVWEGGYYTFKVKPIPNTTRYEIEVIKRP